MRAADIRLAVAAWPWPSGMVAGMPSIRMRTPRTPKVERVPKPRTDSCKSCAKFCRSRICSPGTAPISSDRLTSGEAVRNASTCTASIAPGASKRRCSARLALMTTSLSEPSAGSTCGACWACAVGQASATESATAPCKKGVVEVGMVMVHRVSLSRPPGRQRINSLPCHFSNPPPPSPCSPCFLASPAWCANC